MSQAFSLLTAEWQRHSAIRTCGGCLLQRVQNAEGISAELKGRALEKDASELLSGLTLNLY